MKKRRGNSRYIVIFITVIIIAVIIYRLSAHFIGKIDFFQIKNINFAGNSSILTSELTEAVLPLYYKNLFQISEKEVKKSLEKFHRINTIDIIRSIPDNLTITITEKKPVFHIKTSDYIIMSIDNNAVIIPPPRDFSKENLPFLSLSLPADSLKFGCRCEDDNVVNIINYKRILTNIIPNFFIYFSEIYFDDKKIVFIEAEQGYRIVFDELNLIDAAKEYMKIKDTFSFDNKTFIDMRQDGFYRITKMEN